MKKNVYLLLLIVCLFTLVGCENKKVNESQFANGSNSSKISSTEKNKISSVEKETVESSAGISKNTDGLLFNDSDYHKVKLLFDMNIRSMPFDDAPVVYMAKADTELYLSNVSKLANGFGGTITKPQINHYSATFDKFGTFLGFIGANRIDMSKVYIQDLKENSQSLIEQEVTVRPTENAKIELVKTTKSTPCYFPRLAGGISEATAMTIPPNTELFVTFDDVFKTTKNSVQVGAFITKENGLAYVEIGSLEK